MKKTHAKTVVTITMALTMFVGLQAFGLSKILTEASKKKTQILAECNAKSNSSQTFSLKTAKY